MYVHGNWPFIYLGLYHRGPKKGGGGCLKKKYEGSYIFFVYENITEPLIKMTAIYKIIYLGLCHRQPNGGGGVKEEY